MCYDEVLLLMDAFPGVDWVGLDCIVGGYAFSMGAGGGWVYLP